MTYRNRQLLDLARELPCTIELPGCVRENTVPSHSNRQKHGKGMSEKAADVYFAASCPHCHFEIDHGKTLSREERQEAWQRGFERTILLLWERRLVVVSNPQSTNTLAVKKARKVNCKEPKIYQRSEKLLPPRGF